MRKNCAARVVIGAVSVAAVTGLMLSVAGCQGPNKVNIELRKQLQDKDDKIATLTRQHEADRASLAAAENRDSNITTLPGERLAELFTTNGITLGKLTRAEDFDPNKPGQDGLKVYITPTDENADEIKAGGSVVVEAFDLAADTTRIGRWEYSAAEAKSSWSSVGLLYAFVLKCPWQSPPMNKQVTVKVTFTDALTGRVFNAQKMVTVDLPDR